MKIKVGIVGYGNVGKGVENEIKKYKDMELVAIFTRRDLNEIISDNKVYSMNDIHRFIGKIDVMILCLSSVNDLSKYTHIIARNFNTIDSFDVHSKINEYYKHINKVNRKSGTVSLVSIGWDPGILSIGRLMFESILPNSNTYTFWGDGVSQGHSEAIMKISSVKKAIQYTHPKEDAINKVREGLFPKFKAKDKHTRECFVVLEEDNVENRKSVEKQIKTMPNYFSEYDVTVNYINEEEFDSNHTKMPHAGFTICSGITGENNRHTAELSVKLDSNPEFTASILISYTRAVHKLFNEKKYGTYTIYEVPLSYISHKNNTDLIKKVL
jgi:diaminopimelate dehydrogenase